MTAPTVQMTPKLAAMLSAQERAVMKIEMPEEFQARIKAGEEKELQRDAEAYLRSAKGVRFLFHDQSRGANRAGIPDLLFCYLGRAVGVELKTSVGKLSDAQDRTQEEMKWDGWRVATCRSIPELKAFLATLENQKETEQ